MPGRFSPFFTVSWYLSGGISSDVPSIAPLPTAQDWYPIL